MKFYQNQITCERISADWFLVPKIIYFFFFFKYYPTLMKFGMCIDLLFPTFFIKLSFLQHKKDTLKKLTFWQNVKFKIEGRPPKTVYFLFLLSQVFLKPTWKKSYQKGCKRLINTFSFSYWIHLSSFP